MNTHNLKALSATIFVLVVIWLGGGAFLDLVKEIYHFLDKFIWAFFAGIMAFFISISIIGIMFQISMIMLGLMLGVIAAILAAYKKHKGRSND